jgi:chromosome segregation ATPase
MPNMAVHLRITCPRCQRGNLRIRPEHVGLEVQCKHCGHFFIARAAESPTSNPPSSQLEPGERGAGLSAEIADRRATATEAEHLRIQAQSASHAAESDVRLRQVQDELARSQDREHELRAFLDLARAELRSSSEAQAELSEARTEIGHLLHQIGSLSGRADAVDRLEAELRFTHAEAELLRAQLQEARATLCQSDPGGVEAMARDLATLRDERDLLREGLQELRCELEASSAAAASADQLARDLEILRAERDRLNADQQAGSGREERLRDEIRQLERSLSESTASHETARATIAGQLEEARARWESERQAIHREWDERLRAHVRDGERRLGEEQARAMAVQQQELQQREDDRSQFDRELDSLREETERLRNQLQARSQECDELAGRAEGLVHECAAGLEQAEARRQEVDRLAADRTKAEAALHEAERRYQAENDRLRQALEAARDQADLAARDVSGELERRLAEVQDRLRTETERANQMAAEYQAVCERLDSSHRSHARDSSNAGDSSSSSAISEAALHDRSAAELRLDELNEELRLCRAANERLRSLLRVFGLVKYLSK